MPFREPIMALPLSRKVVIILIDNIITKIETEYYLNTENPNTENPNIEDLNTENPNTENLNSESFNSDYSDFVSDFTEILN